MAEYTGLKELIVDKIETDPRVTAAGLPEGAVYRADTVYETVDHDEFLVVRFGDPSSTMGANAIIPFEILGYCASNNTNRMKTICAAAVQAVTDAASEETDTGRFITAEYVSIGKDLYDVGYRAIVLVTNMRCVGSGY